MIKLLIRYTAMTMCTYYIYIKLLKLKKSKNCISVFISLFLLSISISTIAYFLSTDLQYLVSPLIILFYFIYFAYYSNNKPETIFTTLILSYGICYGFYILSASITATLLAPCFYIIVHTQNTNLITFQILTTFLQVILCTIPFRFKRLKNGMPFLNNKLVSIVGTLTGSSILFCSMVISTWNAKTLKETDKFYLLLFPFIFILSIFIFIWWRKQLQQTYLMKLRQREYNWLESQLKDCQKNIASLQEENRELSKLIHRDNKLIPSLQLAVHTFISTCMEHPADAPQKGSILLAQLEDEMNRRSGIINKLSVSQRQLASTKVPSIDNLLNYMMLRCLENEITFDISLSGNVIYLTQEIIQEKDLLTLLADLIENALIATKCRHGKYIFLHIGVVENHYTLDIWDSGIPFPKEVLLNLGKKRYTTHKAQGGSGIGMMTTYELAQKYCASLIIDEKMNNNLYTKKVSFVFDKKQAYQLITAKDINEIHYLKQRKDLEIL